MRSPSWSSVREDSISTSSNMSMKTVASPNRMMLFSDRNWKNVRMGRGVQGAQIVACVKDVASLCVNGRRIVVHPVFLCLFSCWGLFCLKHSARGRRCRKLAATSARGTALKHAPCCRLRGELRQFPQCLAPVTPPPYPYLSGGVTISLSFEPVFSQIE
jgi:hypothetical protein